MASACLLFSDFIQDTSFVTILCFSIVKILKTNTRLSISDRMFLFCASFNDDLTALQLQAFAKVINKINGKQSHTSKGRIYTSRTKKQLIEQISTHLSEDPLLASVQSILQMAVHHLQSQSDAQKVIEQLNRSFASRIGLLREVRQGTKRKFKPPRKIAPPSTNAKDSSTNAKEKEEDSSTNAKDSSTNVEEDSSTNVEEEPSTIAKEKELSTIVEGEPLAIARESTVETFAVSSPIINFDSPVGQKRRAAERKDLEESRAKRGVVRVLPFERSNDGVVFTLLSNRIGPGTVRLFSKSTGEEIDERDLSQIIISTNKDNVVGGSLRLSSDDVPDGCLRISMMIAPKVPMDMRQISAVYEVEDQFVNTVLDTICSNFTQKILDPVIKSSDDILLQDESPRTRTPLAIWFE